MQPFYCLFTGLKAVLQADGAVKYQMAGFAILAVGAEVAQTHELIGGRCLCVFQALFHLTAGENLQRVGVQAGQEVLVCGIGICIVKEVAVLTNLSLCTVVGIHPVNGSALDLPAVSGIAAPGLGIVGSQHLDDLAVFVLDAAGAGNQICALQAALRSVGEQTLKLRNGLSKEIVCFDPKITGECDLACAGIGIVGVVFNRAVALKDGFKK